jgi:hypothetical protein
MRQKVHLKFINNRKRYERLVQITKHTDDEKLQGKIQLKDLLSLKTIFSELKDGVYKAVIGERDVNLQNRT